MTHKPSHLRTPHNGAGRHVVDGKNMTDSLTTEITEQVETKCRTRHQWNYSRYNENLP